MKLGIGLHRHQLDLEHYRFARQCGCTHLVLHLAADEGQARKQLREVPLAAGYAGWTPGDARNDAWTYEALALLTEEANAADLQVEAIDHLDPSLCLDALLRGPDRVGRLERLKTIIRNVGTAGIPVFIYHLFPARESTETYGSFARENAEAIEADFLVGGRSAGRARAPSARIWSRLQACLAELLPVAVAAGVTLAVQPPDSAPPASRGSPSAGACGRLIDLHPSARHGLVFNVAELAAAGEPVYTALAACSQRRRIACVQIGTANAGARHLRETFADADAVDIVRTVRILQANGYVGLIVPGRIPRMDCAAPWHAGVAHALGYLKAALYPRLEPE